MTIADTRVPVLVLQAVAHGPLGIVRSLGRLGVPVYVADTSPGVPAARSRYCRGVFRWDLTAAPQHAVARLLAIGRTIGAQPLLLPTTDDAALFVATHAAALGEAFTLTGPAPDLVHGLCSKERMHHLAEAAGIPTPRALFPRSREDVQRFLDRVTFPVMLKGIDGLKLSRRAGARMFIVDSPRALVETWDAVADPDDPNLMLQEYIPGGDDGCWMLNGYFDAQGDCLFGATGKKIRQYPIHRGATSLGICLGNDTVTRLTRDFMKAIGYRGILDIGFRYDARDDRYKVLDVNPRIGATFRLFAADDGLDVVRALYLDLTGQPVHPATVREGRRWLVEDCDVAAALAYRREGTFRLRDWLPSLRGVEETAYLCRDDPAPVATMCAGDTRKLARAVAAGTRRRLSGHRTASRAVEVPSGPLPQAVPSAD